MCSVRSIPSVLAGKRDETARRQAVLIVVAPDWVAISWDSLHIDTMPKYAPTITFDPQPLQVGHEWHVVAIYPSGQQQHITGFKTEEEARRWITSGSEAWLKERGYGNIRG